MTKQQDMNEKLEEIYAYIVEMIETRGYPPTVRDVMSRFGISSTASVHYYFKKLIDAGKIRQDFRKSRSLELVSSEIPKSKDFIKVPLVGNIAAGSPILAIENNEEIFKLPNNLFSHSGEQFMLRVEGHSMIDIGMFDGDYIIVRKQNTALNGQVVAVLIENEFATVKRFYNEKNRIRLHPENKNMQDFYPENVAVLGLVVGLIRTQID